MSNKPIPIAILAFPDMTASVVYGMYDLMLSAGRDWGIVTQGEPGPELIRPMLVARDNAPFNLRNSVPLVPQASIEECPETEFVCVPEVDLPPGTPLARQFSVEIEWLRQCYDAGKVLAASCSGAILLAEAGLLDGREATTHWAWCDAMTNRFPGIKLRAKQSLVVSGEGQRLIMGGGGTSYLDLTLYLIARVAGVEAAMQVARINLIDWHHIGQQPFARLANTRQVEDAVIARCQVWIAENYMVNNPVTAMVRLSGLAERTFKRRFKQATGMAPLEYVHTLRLEEAKQALEATNQPVEAIAHELGYEDAGYFSRLFRRKVNLTPAQYRKRFGDLRRSLQAPE